MGGLGVGQRTCFSVKSSRQITVGASEASDLPAGHNYHDNNFGINYMSPAERKILWMGKQLNLNHNANPVIFSRRIIRV
jgi:hypothetical protein